MRRRSAARRKTRRLKDEELPFALRLHSACSLLYRYRCRSRPRSRRLLVSSARPAACICCSGCGLISARIVPTPMHDAPPLAARPPEASPTRRAPDERVYVRCIRGRPQRPIIVRSECLRRKPLLMLSNQHWRPGAEAARCAQVGVASCRNWLARPQRDSSRLNRTKRTSRTRRD